MTVHQTIITCFISFFHLDIKITYLHFKFFELSRNNNDYNRNKSVHFVKTKYFIYSLTVALFIIVKNKYSRLPGLLKHMYCLFVLKKKVKENEKYYLISKNITMCVF